MLTYMHQLKALAVLAAAATLAACGGGAATEQNPNTTAPTVQTYTGPAPSSQEVQAFKNNFWVNINGSNRCGACHYAGGQTPNFARNDDVNLAYQAALQVVNLTQPDQSRIVVKVGGGHNCWLSSPTSCADILTGWIRNWAAESGNAGGGGGVQIQLQAPVDKDVGASKTFPASPAGFQQFVYPILTQYCSRCHSPTGTTTQQKPYFASSDINEAYAEVQAKINLDTPAQSRLVLRLRQESHNCWSNCAANAQTMEDAITSFANGIALTQVDPQLVISKALTMYDGTVAAGGNRYETHIIAKYMFKEGSSDPNTTMANDTSGVDPATNLTLSSGATWVGGWGINIGAGGRAQATVAGSKKLSDRIKASGEFSLEVWAAPANVAQEDANIISYSGGAMVRDATISQKAYQYEAMVRSSTTDGDGAPSLLTKDTDRDAQASLQHVVLTYDPVNGRKLYVNGNDTGDMDPVKGGSLAGWDDTFALVLGNETSGTRQWLGLIKFAAIHDRALTKDQVQQNFAAGVGERYFVLFNVSTLTGVAQSYVMYEVSQYDSYAYLFNKPTFISLDPNAKPDNIRIKGVRLGINGTEAPVGQAYIPLDITVNSSDYKAGVGQLLSSVGTTVTLQKGPNADLFFLSFEQIGSKTHVVTDNTVIVAQLPAIGGAQADVGVHLFSELNYGMSKVTGVATTTQSVKDTFALVEQQLPTSPNIRAFVSAQQIGVAQLGISYCSALVDDSTRRAAFFPGFNSGGTLTSANVNTVIDPLVANIIGTGLGASQPDPTNVRTELTNLFNNLCPGGTCSGARVAVAAKAMCTAALASGAITIQ
jgi:cytochrome c553